MKKENVMRGVRGRSQVGGGSVAVRPETARPEITSTETTATKTTPPETVSQAGGGSAARAAGDGVALSQAETARAETAGRAETAARIIVSQQKGGAVINFGTGFANRKQCGGGVAS